LRNVLGKVARGSAPVRVHLVQTAGTDHHFAYAATRAVPDDRTSLAIAFDQILHIAGFDVRLALDVLEDFLFLFVPLPIDQVLQNAGQIFFSEAGPVAAGNVAV